MTGKPFMDQFEHAYVAVILDCVSQESNRRFEAHDVHKQGPGLRNIISFDWLLELLTPGSASFRYVSSDSSRCDKRLPSGPHILHAGP